MSLPLSIPTARRSIPSIAAPAAIPPGEVVSGDYALRFAASVDEVAAVQRLRHAVFVEELAEGDPLAAGDRDVDPFDEQMHHLLIEHRRSGVAVGTYRLQTSAMAADSVRGWYASTLFDLGDMPREWARDGVEIGRACVARGHRNGRVLRLLWRGLARYLQWNARRYLFGCCSVPSRDPREAPAVWALLRRAGVIVEPLPVRALPHAHCDVDGPLIPTFAPRLPPLMQGYFALGAQVVSPPAFDAAFGSIDCLVLLDIADLAPATFRSFFGDAA
ncbi:MAG: GNAT family N-acetyltransferase [Gemmatimonadaceae bacterium]|jgi:putative hemolysin|nr:GNAT family N-acetyltransferase [Gemmatimonadaceae bacterium]